MSFGAIVVGGGIAGSAAALRAAQYNIPTLWIRGDRDTRKSSRGSYVYNVDNMIGIHDGVVKEPMISAVEPVHPDCAQALREQHFHIGTAAIIENTLDRVRSDHGDVVTVVDARATAARQDAGEFVVEPTGEPAGNPGRAPHLILATGVSDRQPRIKKTLPSGKALDDIHWVFPYANHETFLYCIRCEGHLTREVPTAVIGHSATAAEVALMLHERYDSPVTLLTNGEEAVLPERTRRLLDAYGIGVRSERIVEIQGDRRSGDLHGLKLESGPDVEVRFAFVALGLHRVFNDLAVQLGCDLEDGPAPEESHVIVGPEGETSVRGCFAVGDLATHESGAIRKQIYTAQEYAVRAVDRIDRRRRAARRDALLDSGAG